MKRRAFTIKLLLIGFLGVMLVSQHPHLEGGLLDCSLETLGYLLLVAAAIGRLWCAAYISGNKKTQLVVSGPYSLVRNPLYFFSLLGFIGAGFAMESLTAAAVFALVFTLTHVPAIRKEEGHLLSLFGDTFADYKARVPRFFPRSLTMTQPDRLEFSPRLFNRAVVECTMVLMIFILARGLEWAHLSGVIPVFFHLP